MERQEMPALEFGKETPEDGILGFGSGGKIETGGCPHTQFAGQPCVPAFEESFPFDAALAPDLRQSPPAPLPVSLPASSGIGGSRLDETGFSEESAGAFFGDDEFPAYEESDLFPESTVSGVDYIAGCRDLPVDFSFRDLLLACFTNINTLTRECHDLDRWINWIGFFPILFFLIGILTGSRLLFVGVFFVVPLMMLFAYGLAFFRKSRRAWSILAFGRRTEAVILECRTCVRDSRYIGARSTGTDRHWHMVRFRFRDGDGNAHVNTVYYPATEKYSLSPGSRCYVYYDPGEPRKSLLVGGDWKQFCFCLDNLELLK